MSIINLPCGNTITPVPGEWITGLRQLGHIASIQATSGNIEAANILISQLRTTFSTISAPSPIYSGVRNIEQEMELHAKALVQDYKVFFQFKVLETINSLVSIPYDITVPYVNLKVSDILSNPTACKNIIKSTMPNIPIPYNSIYTGVYNINCPTYYAHEVFSWIMNYIQTAYLTVLKDAFSTLISTFQTIWDSLSLPSFPTFTIPDMDSILSSAEIAGQGNINNIIANLKSINIPLVGTLNDVIGFNSHEFVDTAEQELSRLKMFGKDFGAKGVLVLIENWMEQVTSFFDAIGLTFPAPITIPFSFCSFITYALPSFPPTIQNVIINTSGGSSW